MRRSAFFSGTLIFIILGVWESACRGFNVPDFILPMPSRIISVAVFQAPMLLPHAAITAMEVLIGILLSVEIILNAANINFIAFAHFSATDAVAGAIFPIFVMAVSASEMAVALAIIISLYRQSNNLDSRLW